MEMTSGERELNWYLSIFDQCFFLLNWKDKKHIRIMLYHQGISCLLCVFANQPMLFANSDFDSDHDWFVQWDSAYSVRDITRAIVMLKLKTKEL